MATFVNGVEQAAEGAGGATTRAGGNTSEGTTTSTSATDLLSSAGMSIATSSHIRLVHAGRKTSGNASSAGMGITMNSTTLIEATSDGWAGYQTTTTDRAENGGVVISFGPRFTNYDAMALGYMINKIVSSGLRAGDEENRYLTDDNFMPLATVTDIDLRGISGNASVTLGVDEYQIHTFSSS